MNTTRLRAPVRASRADAPRCYRCDEPIAEGDWMVPCSFSARRSAPLEARAALHLTCAGDVHLDETLTIVSRDELASNQHSAYRAALLRSTVPSAEPLRDRRNRPRVTVKIMGNAATDRAASWVDLQTHARDMAVCSARCEYVFEAVRDDESMLAPTDRRRPIGACAVAALVEPPTSKVHAAKLAAMFEAGYGAPLLWVLGEGSRDARDARVRALRADRARPRALIVALTAR